MIDRSYVALISLVILSTSHSHNLDLTFLEVFLTLEEYQLLKRCLGRASLPFVALSGILRPIVSIATIATIAASAAGSSDNHLSQSAPLAIKVSQHWSTAHLIGHRASPLLLD